MDGDSSLQGTELMPPMDDFSNSLSDFLEFPRPLEGVGANTVRLKICRAVELFDAIG